MRAPARPASWPACWTGAGGAARRRGPPLDGRRRFRFGRRNAADAARAHLWLAKAAEDAATRRMSSAPPSPSIRWATRRHGSRRWLRPTRRRRAAHGAGGSDAEGSGDATGDGTAGAGRTARPAGPDGAAGDDAAVAAWLARWAAGADDAGWSSARRARRTGWRRRARRVASGSASGGGAGGLAGGRAAAAPGDRLATAVLADDLGHSPALGRRAGARAGAGRTGRGARRRCAWPPDRLARRGRGGGGRARRADGPAGGARAAGEPMWDPAAVSGAGAPA
ncbi:MAG: hypothetical protein U0470_04460 [Anaerolineae bacterium]